VSLSSALVVIAAGKIVNAPNDSNTVYAAMMLRAVNPIFIEK
jgi:hypothetical protein